MENFEKKFRGEQDSEVAARQAATEQTNVREPSAKEIRLGWSTDPEVAANNPNINYKPPGRSQVTSDGRVVQYGGYQ